MKVFKKILIAILVLFIVAQFFGPDPNEGELASVMPFLEETNPPENVHNLLTETCFDCHSDSTRYPWYNKITPVNYWLANHVNDGKKHFNASNWEGNSVKRKDHKFKELIDMVKDREMPIPSYTWTHTEANLSDAQITSMVDWAEKVRLKYSLEAKAE